VPSTLRRNIERASLPMISWLGRLPRAVPFLLLLALLIAGVVIQGPAGFVLMGLGAAFVAWILYLSWPRLTGSERIMRSAVLLLAVAMAITRLFPKG
jgi:energy-coupling factor transporter transmembrane protein EcfT